MDNDAVARQKAYDKYKNAERSGIKGEALSTLKAAYDAAEAKESSSKGTSGQTNTVFG